MLQTMIITTNDLKIVEATPDCRAIFPEKKFDERENLLDIFPEMLPLLNQETLKSGGKSGSLNLGNGNFRMRIIPAGKFIIFELQDDGGQNREDEQAAELYELKKRNQLLETIIEEAPIGLFLLNEDGTIVYMNKKQEENSRKKRNQLINHDIRTVYRKIFAYPRITEFFNRIMIGASSETSLTIDHYYPQFYKRDMIVKFLTSRLKEHKKIALFVEIEDELYREKRKAEKTGEELRMSRSYLAQLLDASPNMVISVDDKRRVVSFNKTAERLLGFKAGDVYNSPVDRFFPKEDLPKLDLAVSAQVLWYGTFHIFRADQTSFLIELYSTKIKDDKTGRDVATLLLAVDIEERNKLRKNLIQSQKMNFIGELVSGLAHQINNPLVGVVNISDLLLQNTDRNDEKYRYIRMIKEAGENCRDVVSRLLRFSRRHDDTPMVDMDIRTVLESSIDMLLKHPKYKNVLVKRDFSAVSDLRCDPVLLQQAFMNMLINSAQAVDQNGRINVQCRMESGMGRQIVVVISDNGCGIRENDIPRVFEPFFSTKDADEGTGIGLSLSYWIIQDHGGRISVESEPGKGSVFTIYIPVSS
jgi:PAS domain S-box-containing protein